MSCAEEYLAELVALTRRANGESEAALTSLAVDQIRVAQGQSPQQVDFLSRVGTAARSVYLTNLGARVELYFGLYRQQAETAQEVGPIYLLPGSERRISREFEYMRVAPTEDGDVWLQVEAQ